MTAQSFAQARIFAHLVARGMDRAYEAVERVTSEFPGFSIDLVIVSRDGELDRADPRHLPEARALIIWKGGYQDLYLCLDGTTRGMAESIRAMVRYLNEPDDSEVDAAAVPLPEGRIPNPSDWRPPSNGRGDC